MGTEGPGVPVFLTHTTKCTRMEALIPLYGLTGRAQELMDRLPPPCQNALLEPVSRRTVMAEVFRRLHFDDDVRLAILEIGIACDVRREADHLVCQRVALLCARYVMSILDSRRRNVHRHTCWPEEVLQVLVRGAGTAQFLQSVRRRCLKVLQVLFDDTCPLWCTCETRRAIASMAPAAFPCFYEEGVT